MTLDLFADNQLCDHDAGVYYDLRCLLGNLKQAGALAQAWELGSRNGAECFTGMAVRRDGPGATS